MRPKYAQWNFRIHERAYLVSSVKMRRSPAGLAPDRLREARPRARRPRPWRLGGRVGEVRERGRLEARVGEVRGVRLELMDDP